MNWKLSKNRRLCSVVWQRRQFCAEYSTWVTLVQEMVYLQTICTQQVYIRHCKKLPDLFLSQASFRAPVCVPTHSSSSSRFSLHSLLVLHIQHFCFTIFKEAIYCICPRPLKKACSSRPSCHTRRGVESVSWSVFVNVACLRRSCCCLQGFIKRTTGAQIGCHNNAAID